ncbi:MAG: DUF1269 domain-containing protein [Bryobacteraceae bacterium]
MEKLIVVVFDDQTKADAGFEILRQLDRDGEISVYEAQMIAKEPSGSIRYLDNSDKMAFPVIGGSTAVGAFIGLLGGPLAALIGGMAGGLIGSIGDLVHAGVTDEFVDDVNTAMTAGKFAVVADVSEDWVTPLDTRMEEIGGVVFRRTRSEVKRIHHDRDVAAHRAEMAQLKAERAQARSDRQAKIDATIDALRKKLEDAIERDHCKMRFRQNQRDARIQVLKAKADQSQGEIRRRQEARIAEVRRDYEEKPALG